MRAIKIFESLISLLALLMFGLVLMIGASDLPPLFDH